MAPAARHVPRRRSDHGSVIRGVRLQAHATPPVEDMEAIDGRFRMAPGMADTVGREVRAGR
jgi:hypothetical protein